ncbi:MAG: peptidoglycan DD-metalloendopeptidase family protein [Myxococcaceae bacterium]|nr:peptidoglycan DD-metalloendopeptidase family protein [Myxococcaceae bacterium]
MSFVQGFSDVRAAGNDTEQVAKQLEALVLKQMLKASGAFKGSDSAGSSLHVDLFVETLAEAVSQSGGLGLAKSLEPSLHAGPPAAPPPVPPQALALTRLVAADARISSAYGTRADPFDGVERKHSGVDIAAAEGSPVLAAAGGVVRRAGPRDGYGFAVEVDHGDGVTTLYAHASALLVNEGDRVEKGQPVAQVGHSGRATGDHLHFEVRVGNRPVNPTRAFKIYGGRADER